VQVQMSFLATPPTPGVAQAWSALDAGQRAEVVAALARVIAKVIVPDMDEAETEEKGDE